MNRTLGLVTSGLHFDNAGMNRPTDQEINAHIDDLLKPPGSLGELERLAHDLCRIQRTTTPQTTPRRIVLFAGDHHVASQGVTAWPSSVTELMLQTITAGKSASAVFARQNSCDLVLVDVGTFSDSDPPANVDAGISILHRRIRAGARDLSVEPALTVEEFHSAFQIGEQLANEAAGDGMKVVAAGEMGIGNTTPAACLAMLLADVPLEAAVGRGAGVDDAGLSRKREVVATAVRRARDVMPHDELAAIAGVGGLEICAMAGFMTAAADAGLICLLDGYVATAAALIAEKMKAGTAANLIASHQSEERGHALTLAALGLKPYLDWSMRLGEGTAALLLMPMLDLAAAMVSKMGTFSAAGLKKS